MKSIEVRRVELWDGADRTNFGFYTSMEVKKEDIEKAHPHCHVRTEILTIFESLDEQINHKQRDLRRSAWAKMTLEERKACGMVERP